MLSAQSTLLFSFHRVMYLTDNESSFWSQQYLAPLWVSPTIRLVQLLLSIHLSDHDAFRRAYIPVFWTMRAYRRLVARSAARSVGRTDGLFICVSVRLNHRYVMLPLGHIFHCPPFRCLCLCEPSRRRRHRRFVSVFPHTKGGAIVRPSLRARSQPGYVRQWRANPAANTKEQAPPSLRETFSPPSANCSPGNRRRRRCCCCCCCGPSSSERDRRPSVQENKMRKGPGPQSCGAKSARVGRAGGEAGFRWMTQGRSHWAGLT